MIDVDECYHGTHNCSITSNCINTNGSFMCACDTELSRDGSGWSGDGVVCEGDYL